MGDTTRSGLALSHSPASQVSRSNLEMPDLPPNPPSGSADQAVSDFANLSDQDIFDVLLKNDTVAAKFQNACASRLQQYQQTLDQVYHQRLTELDDYTRKWREETKDLWKAVADGHLSAITPSQQNASVWQGPQHVGASSRPPFTSLPSADAALATQPDFGARALNRPFPDTSVGAHRSGLQLPKSRLLCHDWSHDTNGYTFAGASASWLSNGSHTLLNDIYSGDLRTKIQCQLDAPLDVQYLVRLQLGQGGPTYRQMNRPNHYPHRIGPQDVVIDLTAANVAVLGKAFCYMMERMDLWRSMKNASNKWDKQADKEPGSLYDFFCSQPASREVTTRCLSQECIPQEQVFDLLESQACQSSRKLLIARPQYKDGAIVGAEFLDVGSEQRTTPQEAENAVLLVEDASTFTQLLNLLNFCISRGILVLPPAPQVTGCRQNLSEEQPKPAMSQADQLPLPVQHEQSIRQDFGTARTRWDSWVNDVQGQASDFMRKKISKDGKLMAVNMSSKRHKDDFWFLKALGVLPLGIWFTAEDSTGPMVNFDLHRARYVPEQKIGPAAVVMELSEQNVIMFWKAFCLLKERRDRLLALISESLSGASQHSSEDEEILDMCWKTGRQQQEHDRLCTYYRDFLSNKDLFCNLSTTPRQVQHTSVRGSSTFLPPSGDQARLLIARPHHIGQNRRLDRTATEFFDVGYTMPTTRRSDDVVISESDYWLERIAQFLQISVMRNAFPQLKNLETPLRRTEAVGNDSDDEAALGPEEGIEDEVAVQDGRTGGEDGCKTLPAVAPLFTRAATTVERALALSDDLDRLDAWKRNETSQARQNWLYMGCEPRSPMRSPPLAEHIADPDDVEEAKLPLAEVVIDISSHNSDEDENLLMLDCPPGNVHFQSRQKRTAHAESPQRAAKRARLATFDSAAQTTYTRSSENSSIADAFFEETTGIAGKPVGMSSPADKHSVMVNATAPSDLLSTQPPGTTGDYPIQQGLGLRGAPRKPPVLRGRPSMRFDFRASAWIPLEPRKYVDGAPPSIQEISWKPPVLRSRPSMRFDLQANVWIPLEPRKSLDGAPPGSQETSPPAEAVVPCEDSGMATGSAYEQKCPKTNTHCTGDAILNNQSEGVQCHCPYLPHSDPGPALAWGDRSFTSVTGEAPSFGVITQGLNGPQSIDDPPVSLTGSCHQPESPGPASPQLTPQQGSSSFIRARGEGLPQTLIEEYSSHEIEKRSLHDALYEQDEQDEQDESQGGQGDVV